MLLHRRFVEGASQPRRSKAMLEPAVITPSAFTVARPQAGEYAPYYERYISLVQGDDILHTLDQQRRQTMMLLSGRDEEDGNFRYAPEKWSAKEVLGHVCDTERIFAYRALRCHPDGGLRAGRLRSQWPICASCAERFGGRPYRCTPSHTLPAAQSRR